MFRRTVALRRLVPFGLALIACGQPSTSSPWTRSSAVGPEERWGQSAVLDAERNRMLIFGGEWRRGQFHDVWSLDLDAMQFEELAPQGIGPTSRSDGANVLDAARGRWILIGGRVGFDRSLREVWSFDLAAERWTQLPDLPSQRHDVQATSDGRHAWIFGGTGMLFQSTNELWEMDLETNAWRVLPADGPRPTPRTSYAIAYSEGFVYVHGGHDVVRAFSDTWRYDLMAMRWEQLHAEGGAAGNAHAAVTFDAECNAIVMMGGDNLDNFTVSTSEVLVLGAHPTFHRIAASALPPPRDHASLVLDDRRRLIVFGGGSLGDGLDTYDDLWTYPLGACP